MAKKKQEPAVGSKDPDQSYFDGMEPPRFKELDKLIKEFIERRDMAKSCKERMDELKQEIADFMFDHDLRTYVCGETGLDLEELTKARFRRVRMKGGGQVVNEVDDDDFEDPEGDE